MRLSTSAPALPQAVTIYGECARSPESIAAAIDSGRAVELVSCAGDFVIVKRCADRDVIVTSRSGVVNYYYSATAHGCTVGQVMRAARLNMDWDMPAVANFLAIGHLLGDQTVHRDVRRVPSAAVLTVSRDRVEVQLAPRLTRSADPAEAPEAALAALLQAVARAARDGDGLWLSMSGGLDSRLLLATLLYLGYRPGLLVSGVPGSFDRTIASAVAEAFDLRLEVVTVSASSVTDVVPAVAGATGGVLPATHLAGLVHVRALESETRRTVLFGMMGEFARSYYAPPTGLHAQLSASLPRRMAVPFLLRRFRSPFVIDETASLHPDLATCLQSVVLGRRLAQVVQALPGKTALQVGDEFFLTQYGHHKTAADLAALGEYVSWRVPFFDTAWLATVRPLPRHWKLGSRWHRYAIGRLSPALLRFPDEGYGDTTCRHWPPGYWSRGPLKSSLPHYLDRSMFRTAPLRQWILDRGDVLDDLVPEHVLRSVVTGQKTRRPRIELMYSLAALGIWREQL